MNKYSWTKKYSVSPQIAGEIIESLPEKTAEALLRSAKKKSSPLHNEFEWDNDSAAKEYRLIQARVMINSLKVEVITNDNPPVNITAFIQKAAKPSSYISIIDADNDDLSAAEIRCLNDMRSFKDKYKGLEIARNVISEISAIEASVSRRRA